MLFDLKMQIRQVDLSNMALWFVAKVCKVRPTSQIKTAEGICRLDVTEWKLC